MVKTQTVDVKAAGRNGVVGGAVVAMSDGLSDPDIYTYGFFGDGVIALGTVMCATALFVLSAFISNRIGIR